MAAAVEQVLGAAFRDSSVGQATHGLAGGAAMMMGDEGDVCALCFVLCAATPFRDMVAGGCVGVAALAALSVLTATSHYVLAHFA